MSPPIPFLMPNPITEGLKKLELSDAISSGRVLMLDMVRRLSWYGTYCMPARAWIILSGSGMICRLLDGLAARQALQHSSDQDVMCAVTCCPLEAVLSSALVHHAATSSHGGDHIGYSARADYWV
jgi:hypothetical protein